MFNESPSPIILTYHGFVWGLGFWGFWGFICGVFEVLFVGFLGFWRVWGFVKGCFPLFPFPCSRLSLKYRTYVNTLGREREKKGKGNWEKWEPNIHGNIELDENWKQITHV